MSFDVSRPRDVYATNRHSGAPRLAYAAITTIMVFVSASSCRADPAVSGSVEVSRPFGDVYNERTTDGDAYPQSLSVRALVARGDLTLSFDYRRNVYLTDNRGPATRTQYAKIEGGTGTSIPFLARESSSEVRLERVGGRRSLTAIGIGVLRTWTNYNYPSLTGFGLGIERRPAPGPGLRPFGSLFYYPSASGPYTTEQQPARTITPSFHILKLDYGLVVRAAHTGLYAVAGYGNELRRGNGLSADNRFIRSDPYVAIGTHFGR